MEDLLRIECSYWKKRCTIRWIKQGEDNTQKIHAIATERFRRNTIAMLKDGKGTWYLTMKFWREILAGIDMQFDFGSLLTRVDGLEELTRPFDIKEMDDVIAAMPIDKAPRPNGFNGLFFKRCWPIIKQDFYSLAKEFMKEILICRILTAHILL